MASNWPEEDSFACSICLEALRDPATLPCGHSYCLLCIQNHWDGGEKKGQYTCPQCRKAFNPRPLLAKSTMLAEAMEKLKTNSFRQSSFSAQSSAPPSMPLYLEVLPDVAARKGSVYPQLPAVDVKLCPQHHKPLDLFCHEDRESVCEVCCQHGHQEHKVLKLQDERTQRQEELVQMQAEVQRRIQEAEKKVQELPRVARQQKLLLQALEKDSSDTFAEMMKNLNLTSSQVAELLSYQTTEVGSNMEGEIQQMEQEVVQLKWKSEGLSRLAGMEDHTCFLKNFLLLEPIGEMNGTEDSVFTQNEDTIPSILSVMKELQKSVEELSKSTVAKISSIVGTEPTTPKPDDVVDLAPANTLDQTYEPKPAVGSFKRIPPPLPPPRPQAEPLGFRNSIICEASSPLPPPRLQASGTTPGFLSPEPKTREEMLKYRFEPTLDPNTVYRHMLLSDDGRKTTLRAENLNPPDHPERFFFWRQVLCREPLAGSPYYWEVEWTGQKITVGVAYKEMERKTSDNRSRLGHNDQSWCLYWSGTGFSFWHNNQEKLLGSPKAKKIGVFLDQYEGILNFYRIDKKKAIPIYHHQTQFSGPLYPGFRLWGGVGDTLTVCKLD